MRYLFTLSLFIFTFISVQGQLFKGQEQFTRQDSLRGTNNEFRNWYNVLHYAIAVEPDFEKLYIQGTNKMRFKVNSSRAKMQIDLQKPMELDRVLFQGKELNYEREGNVYWITFKSKLKQGKIYEIDFHYTGNPRRAVKAPWDGGWIFTYDANKNPWMAVACQGLGASVWYPCKDYLGDEPDNGMDINLISPKGLVGVSNGRLEKTTPLKNGKTAYLWRVKNPINTYNVVPQFGKYINFKDSYKGLKGNLDLDYWVIDYNKEKAQKQFQQTHKMLEAFEHWMGAYPFYEDSFKLIETPFLGMEHQSGIAYGNGFRNGYLGSDLSRTGEGLKFDFILVHEAGHEWFGNNITAKDIADMWIHESFTAYSETLYLDYHYGKKSGNTYAIGTQKSIHNNKTIIGVYGVNNEGSEDMYYKGANMLHMIRQIIGNIEFRKLLHELYTTYYHKTTTTKEIEKVIQSYINFNLCGFFNQYLRSVQIPVFETKKVKNKIHYRFKNVVPKFKLKLKTTKGEWILASKKWKIYKGKAKELKIDSNFYIYQN